MSGIRRSQPGSRRVYRGRHRREHWYHDNQIYFITARCRGRYPAFAEEAAKGVFWDRFSHYTRMHGFEPWVTSLLDNHYHTVGYLHKGSDLGPMMRKLHGSVAKLVNDTLTHRLVPFWSDRRDHDYFDGCLRDEKQGRLTYRYVLTQAERHGVMPNWRDYPHTRVVAPLETAIDEALRRRAFLFGVCYRRYGH